MGGLEEKVGHPLSTLPAPLRMTSWRIARQAPTLPIRLRTQFLADTANPA